MSTASVKLATALVLFFSTLLHVSAQCPDICFCKKSTADFVCGIPFLNGRCEVGKCSKAECSNKGYRCQPKITASPGILQPALITAIRAEIEKKGGCKGNVCFAIDGSGSIRPNQYKNQQDFVADVVRILATFDTRVAGTQYARKSNPIRALSTDLNGFIDAMYKQKQDRGGTSISSGIKYCGGEVDKRPFEPKKVVVLGDGFQNVDRNAVMSANTVRSNKGLVSVVAVKGANDKLLLDIAGGDKSLKFETMSFNDRFALGVIIRELTLAICTK